MSDKIRKVIKTTTLDKSLWTLELNWVKIKTIYHTASLAPFNVDWNLGNIRKCCSLFQHCLGEGVVLSGGGVREDEGDCYKISGKPLMV